MAELCTVCRRREPDRGQVCEGCRTTISGLLADLPRKLRLLPLMLMPGQAPAGEKVSSTRVGSPTSARLDALSLVGPGSVPVPGALHPLVRRWSTQRIVQVQARVGALQVNTHTTTITDWHSEPVIDKASGKPVMVPDDDQIGVLPPSEWLDQQATEWRSVLGHHDMPVAYATRVGPRAPRDIVQWVLANGTPEQVKAMFAVQQLTRDYRQGVADLVAGHEPGYSGHRPERLREDDPVADLWTLRFGEPSLARAATVNIRYLHTWLPRAAEHDGIDVARFAADLRSLSAELTRVLGEKPDQQWLGRCPATLVTDDDEVRGTCGAGLWQDPHASVVECPRCHSAWGPRVVHLVHLAAEIRRVWPLDRRRRYSSEERYALQPIPCPGCGQPTTITWQRVTGVSDTQPWWRPVRTRCPDAGGTCTVGGNVL